MAGGIHKVRRHIWVGAVKESRQTGQPSQEIFDREMAAVRESIGRSAEFEARRQRERDESAERREAEARRLSRRQLLKRGAGTAVAAGAASAFSANILLPSRASAVTAPRVVVVGAGNAGLTAAWRMFKGAGWPVQVYEARTRVGGRTWTDKSYFNAKQWFEHGGGGVNTNEKAGYQSDGIGALINELGMGSMYDLWLNYPNGGDQYFFNGADGLDDSAYTAAENAASSQFDQSVWPFTYASQNAFNRQYAGMTATQWIDAYVPEGMTGSAGKDIAYAMTGGEYGARPDDISAFHLIADLGTTTQVFPYRRSTYDERWGVPGGNDNVAKTIASKLPAGSVHLGQQLVAVKQNTDNTYTLTFSSGGVLSQVVCDYVFLAVPTGKVIQAVDMTQAGLSALKLASFQKPNGTNSKITLQFTDQVWGANSYSGDVESDTVVSEGWQASYINTNGTYGGSSFAPPLQVVLNNADYSAYPDHGPAPAAVVSQILAADDALYPSPKASASFNGKAYLDNWVNDPFAGGSYCYYRPGQWAAFGGYEATAEGGVYFCGEHTAPYAERGMMSGAVKSGNIAARALLAKFGITA
ncbi:NAD(P)/FAD-dependent oxidoreductase [Catenulispora subtropica]|uniref:Amine oxidase domain-containing protein n=1 Tax=Catenulispora subtropica TaxID=450798 RepID=A0ABN2RM70_9ACTN